MPENFFMAKYSDNKVHVSLPDSKNTPICDSSVTHLDVGSQDDFICDVCYKKLKEWISN